MGLKRLAEKVAEYRERLERGKASKIKPSHVRKILDKLRNKALELETEIGITRDPEKKARLRKKLGIARQQIERAEWLLGQIN